MLEEIRIWKRKEGFLIEPAWLDEGIKLYRDLLRKNPDCIEYKVELAKLLVRSGTDEKLLYVNLMNASDLFNEVLDLFPDHMDALYRMGHIGYETQDYERSIELFTKAIKLPLSNIRMFRAYATMSKAFFKLGDDEKAHSYLEKAKEMDRESNFSSEIKGVETLLTQEGYFSRVIKYPDGAYIFATVDDAEDVLTENESKEATLDLAHFRPTFSGPRDVACLQRKEAELLSYLIEKKRLVTKEELIQYVWPEDEAPEPTSVKPMISKINRKVKKCLLEDTKNPITNRRGQGYKWSSIETKIIKVL